MRVIKRIAVSAACARKMAPKNPLDCRGSGAGGGMGRDHHVTAVGGRGSS